MDILEPWLAATIDGKLSEALRHWEEVTNKHHSAGKSQGLAYDDGSNLRIPSAKKGPVVQITKVGRSHSWLYLANHVVVVLDLQKSNTSHTIGQRYTDQCFHYQPGISTIR